MHPHPSPAPTVPPPLAVPATPDFDRCALARFCVERTHRSLSKSRDHMDEHHDVEMRQTRSFADSDDCLRRSADGLGRSYRALRATATSLHHSHTALHRAHRTIDRAGAWAFVSALTPAPAGR